MEAHRRAAELRHGYPIKVTMTQVKPIADEERDVYEVTITLERDETRKPKEPPDDHDRDRPPSPKPNLSPAVG